MLYLARRSLQMLLILVVLSAALFGLLASMPGNPVDLLITSNPNVKPEDIIRLRRLRGLDRPWYVQYFRWIYGHGEPARPPVVHKIPPQHVRDLDGGFAIDLSEYLADPNFMPNSDDFALWLKELWPSWPETKNSALIKQALVAKDSAKLMELIGEANPLVQSQLARKIELRSAKQLTLKGLFGAQADGLVLKKSDGQDPRAWFLVSNSYGQQKTGRIALHTDGHHQDLMREIAPQTVENDDKTFSLDLKKFLADETAQQDVTFTLLNDSPGIIDNGVYTNKFHGEGQQAILAKVTRGSMSESFAFDVEHGVIGHEKKFNRGFLFFFVGDKNALGFSHAYKRPVYDISAGRIANTIQLMLPALLISLLFAIPLGVWSALRQYSLGDYVINFLAFLGISLPVFWFGIMMIFVFAEMFQLLPAGGVATPGISSEGSLAVLLDRLKYAILPTMVLSIFYVGRWLRYMRAAMLEVLPMDYIRTARAKGLSEKKVILKHALRNALVPVVTVLAISIPSLFGGAVLTETVFSWPGIGRLQYEAVINSDYYVAIVVFLLEAMLVMAGNLLADLAYVLVDPRMRKV